jgi:hypothetical protein
MIASQWPRPVPALGLRGGRDGFSIKSQTRPEKEMNHVAK